MSLGRKGTGRRREGRAEWARPGGKACLVLLAVSWTAAVSWQATFGGVAFAAWPHLGVVTLPLVVSAGGLWWMWAGRRDGVDGEAGERPARRLELALGVVALALAVAAIGWDAWWHARRPGTGYFLVPPHALGAATALVLLLWAGTLRPFGRFSGDVEDAAGPGGVDGTTALLGGLAILFLATVASEYVGRPNYWHGSEFYVVSAVVFPGLLATLAGASDGRFTATLAALVYPATVLGVYAVLLVLPPSVLSGASGADAGPFVLPHVPILLFVPALAIDGIVDRMRRPRSIVGRWTRTGVLGGAFVVLHLAAHWPAATLLVSRGDTGPLARTWPAGAEALSYATQFWNLDRGTIAFGKGMVLAVVLATVSAGIGLWIGERARR